MGAEHFTPRETLLGKWSGSLMCRGLLQGAGAQPLPEEMKASWGLEEEVAWELPETAWQLELAEPWALLQTSLPLLSQRPAPALSAPRDAP